MKILHILVLLAVPFNLYASFSVGPADVGFPDEFRPFRIKILSRTLPNGADGAKKRVYEISLIAPKEMNDKLLSHIELLSDDGYPENMAVSLKVDKFDKTHFIANVRLSEAVAMNFVLRARYSDYSPLLVINPKTIVSSDDKGYVVSLKDQIIRFDTLK